MKTLLCMLVLYSLINPVLIAQNVGIGAGSPNALFHVNVGPAVSRGILVTGNYHSLGSIPDLGPGTRLMFYPGKGAFRAGSAYGTEWDDANVGPESNATGVSTIASGYNSTAMGRYSIASGQVSMAIGSSTVASGSYAFATGYQSEATGTLANTFGDSTIASGSYTTAMGRNSVARGWASMAVGHHTVAKGYASTVIGVYNDSIYTGNQMTFTSGTPLFIVGNGNAKDDRSNAMVVLKNGNVGIGENAPTEALVLNKNAATTLQLQAAGVEKGFVQLSGDHLRLGTYSSNNLGQVIFRLDGSDRFTIYPSGNATLTGTLTQNSDARLKRNIAPINNAIQQLSKINGYQYYWKSSRADPGMQTGVLAQELQKVLPELVKENAEGILSVNYSGLIPYMIEAAKTQQQEIAELKDRLSRLEEAVLKLRD